MKRPVTRATVRPGRVRGDHRRSPARWGGSLFLWHGAALYVGHASDTTSHAHHALQICIGLEGSFRLRVAPGETWNTYRGAVVASDRPHQLDGGGAALGLLYLDPESADAGSIGRAHSPSGVGRLCARDVAPLVPALAACLRKADDVARARAAHDAVVRTLSSQTSDAGRVDPRVVHAIAVVESLPERRIGLAELAAHVGLSSSRFAHLFRAHAGLPLRRYLLWMRLQDALAAMAAGASLTRTAIDAGFADSAHLTRTFRRMFGLAPSDLARHGRLVRAPSASGGGSARSFSKPESDR